MDGPVVLELHKNSNYIDECCDLLNAEWPRSKVGRMRSLQVSRDGLPTRLILLYENKVIGHSKISPIPSEPLACFIESVVIRRCQRGRGFGKQLMLESENFAKQQGLYTVYLSTKDKVEFYSKLGYNICEPITIYGCNIALSADFCSNKALLPKTVSQLTVLSGPNQHSGSENLTKTREFLGQSTLHSLSPPPPPPLPLPLQPLHSKVCKGDRPTDNSNTVFMKKSL